MISMQIIIRLDDIAPGMDFAKFHRMRELLEKYNIKPIIGVVPECRDENLCIGSEQDGVYFWQMVHKLKSAGWIVAQHGTYHVYETENSGLLGINPFSEFAGLPYEVQFKRLKEGKDILERRGIFTDIFMAPGHTYDDNTVRALKELGFNAITDGLYDKPYVYKDILCVPCRLQDAGKTKGFDTLCFHTNLMEEEDFKDLENFIENNRESIITFDAKELEKIAIPWSKAVAKKEAKALKARKRKDTIAHSKKLAWYLSYTNHNSSKIKWLKRVLYLPLLLTNKYKEQ